MAEKLTIAAAQLGDQGKLGELLLAIFGESLRAEEARERKVGIDTAPAEDTLMAADDFYFSQIDLMDCCFFARAGERIVGAVAFNPYVSEVQYVAVLPEYRRQGLGRGLVEAAFSQAQKRGLSHLKVNIPADFQAGAEKFFAALDFLEVRKSVLLGRKI